MMKYLWHNQKCRRNLQLDFQLLSPSIDDILGEDAPAIKSSHRVDELEVNFAASVDANSARKLLCFLDLNNLQKVKITLVPRNDRGISFADSFFIHHFPTVVTHITLNFVALPGPEYLRFDLYPSLTYMDWHDCQHTGRVLDAFRKLILRKFSCHYTDLSTPLDKLAFMLQHFSTLEKLVLETGLLAPLQNLEMLMLGIVRHNENLKSLLPFNSGPNSKDRLGILLRAATRCRRLRQLALEFDYQP